MLAWLGASTPVAQAFAGAAHLALALALSFARQALFFCALCLGLPRYWRQCVPTPVFPRRQRALRGLGWLLFAAASGPARWFQLYLQPERAHTLDLLARAQAAGYGPITLLEEPQAALYSWIQHSGGGWRKSVKKGDIILSIDGESFPGRRDRGKMAGDARGAKAGASPAPASRSRGCPAGLKRRR